MTFCDDKLVFTRSEATFRFARESHEPSNDISCVRSRFPIGTGSFPSAVVKLSAESVALSRGEAEFPLGDASFSRRGLIFAS